MNHIFKVGDRIKPTHGFAPNATIIELTERGFRFRYDEVLHSHPNVNVVVIEGEEYLDVHPEFPRWEVINDDNSEKSESPFLFYIDG